MASFIGAVLLVFGFWAVTGEAGFHDTSWATVCTSIGGTWNDTDRAVGECVK